MNNSKLFRKKFVTLCLHLVEPIDLGSRTDYGNVAQMLVRAGHKLYFYARSDPKNSENRMEIDFLIVKKGITSWHNISPIEVKSSRNYTFTSLRKFMVKYAEQLHIPWLLHPGDYREENQVTFLPLYMTPLL